MDINDLFASLLIRVMAAGLVILSVFLVGSLLWRMLTCAGGLHEAALVVTP